MAKILREHPKVVEERRRTFRGWGLQWLIYLAALLHIGQTFGLLATLVFRYRRLFIIGIGA
jgi:hypothetical protein